MVAAKSSDDNNKRFLIFTYGTLKRGFSNHVLLQDLIRTGDASFVGPHRTVQKLPLVCGPYRVPFLLNLPAAGAGAHHVAGELYSVTVRARAKLDDLEGTTRGHYERLSITLFPDDGVSDGADGGLTAEAYFAHRSYAMELWKRNGKRGFECYTEKEASGYVKRKDRPQNLTFLDHIRMFLTSVSD